MLGNLGEHLRLIRSCALSQSVLLCQMEVLLLCHLALRTCRRIRRSTFVRLLLQRHLAPQVRFSFRRALDRSTVSCFVGGSCTVHSVIVRLLLQRHLAPQVRFSFRRALGRSTLPCFVGGSCTVHSTFMRLLLLRHLAPQVCFSFRCTLGRSTLPCFVGDSSTVHSTFMRLLLLRHLTPQVRFRVLVCIVYPFKRVVVASFMRP